MERASLLPLAISYGCACCMVMICYPLGPHQEVIIFAVALCAIANLAACDRIVECISIGVVFSINTVAQKGAVRSFAFRHC
jgi:hypothetical protein